MNRRQIGDGDLCPVAPDHGHMFLLPGGKQYCPDQSHDGRSPNLFESDGKTPVRRKK